MTARPAFHHINLRTRRLQEMIDWYATVVGATPTFRYDGGAWLTNDNANHRVALLASPTFADDPQRDERVGMHHSAFEYERFADFNAGYLRLRDEGIEPDFCLDHGMTLSYYYTDPDGNRVEIQVDLFGDWAASTEWMRTSAAFAVNPIGIFVDPAKIAIAAVDLDLAEIHARALAGELLPDTAQD